MKTFSVRIVSNIWYPYLELLLQVYGWEYDLDLFNIVAVPDFNM